MDLYQWGEVHFMLADTEAIVYKSRSKAQYSIRFNEDKMEVDYLLDGRKLVSFTDKLNDRDNLGTFTRKINNQEFHPILKIYF